MKKIIHFILICVSVFMAAGCQNSSDKSNVTDYSQAKNWAMYQEGSGDADLFFLCPTADLGDKGNKNFDINNEESRANFLSEVKMYLGIFNENATAYAPYFQQVTFPVYTTMTAVEREPYLATAYADVKAAFETYLKKCDSERPLIIAGYSQGADMTIRLLKDFGNDSSVKSRLVSAYAIGWPLTKEDVEKYPYLIPASGEDDNGSIVTFECEAEDTPESFIMPKGTWTYSINPLNWKTDTTAADKSLNLGACFTDFDGNITKEIPALTGAVIDSKSGIVICPDVTPSDYPGKPLLADGVYHMYNCNFFYRNLQKMFPCVYRPGKTKTPEPVCRRQYFRIKK